MKLLAFVFLSILRLDASAGEDSSTRLLRGKVGRLDTVELIKAETNEKVMDLFDSKDVVTIDLADFGLSEPWFNVRAVTSDSESIESVALSVDETDVSLVSTNKNGVYTMCGFYCAELTYGKYTLTLTPYDGTKEGKDFETTISIVNTAPPPVPPPTSAPVPPPTRAPVPPPTKAPVEPPVPGEVCGTPKFVGEWINTPEIEYPISIGEGQGGMIGNDFVIAGGFLESVKNATCQTYALDVTDPSAGWRQMDDCPEKLGITHAAAVVVGTKLYLLGGYLGGNMGPDGIGQEVTHAFEYDHSKPPGQQWKELTPLPDGRAGGGVIYDSTYNALVFGAGAIRPFSGKLYAEDQPEAWMYSFENPSAGWVRVADVLFPANHQQYATAIDSTGKERHYFLGGQIGRDEKEGNLDTVAEYDFASNTWTPKNPMPIPRSHATSSTRAYGCGFVMVSGTTNGHIKTKDISYYEPESDSWTSIGELPHGLNTPVCVVSKINDEDWLLCETGWVSSHYSCRRKMVLG